MKNHELKIILAALAFGISRSWAAVGTADLLGTAPSSIIKGTVHFEDTPAGLHITVQLTNVPPGMHGFHIHESGSCADLGKAAGSHYNPMNMPHGQVLKDGMTHAHAGDLGNITADASGSAKLDVTLPGVSMAEGKYTVGGRSVILHEKADDFSQPAGNAGGRIGCGSILITSPAPR